MLKTELIELYGFRTLKNSYVKDCQMILDLLEENPILIPVLQNTNLGGYQNEKGNHIHITGPIPLSKEQKIPIDIRISLGKELLYLNPIEGKGLNARIEELFQLNKIKVTGTHTLKRTNYAPVTFYIVEKA